ncbi:NrfD/PsrC family molybdoenzyme membrane anchor subunit [Fundidesulfovibrio soli]|uniref:NrfD/PsrC family molybdoenzyme membrane anchor subunit n=1 Tax=Fundidesulfovibrio soli TaxID=2922716 RepID=UPI001FAFDAA6|nr:NrfD/PsrC family molybdoenzyme membrane anchor subunit [Fundidesulfovibrio soli]
MNARVNKPLLYLSFIGLAALAYSVVDVFIHRTGGTHLGSYVPWGMGVVMYLLFVGFSAGGLLVSALTQMFGVRELKPLGGLATYAALVAEVCAGIAIASDLGRFERMFNFLLSPSLTSPMWWMFLFFSAVLFVSFMKAWAFAKRDDGLVAFWSWVSIPVGLCFYFTNGFFFSVLTGHGLWSGPVVPLLFVCAALLCGGALVTALAWWSMTNREGVIRLGCVVQLLLVAFVVLEGLWLWIGWQGGRVETLAAMRNLSAGPGAWAFWGLHVFAGMALPLFLLPQTEDNPGLAAWACLLILVGFAGARWAFVVPAQSVPMLPGLDTAWQHPRLMLSYLPSLAEWSMAAGVSGLALFGFLMGPRFFPGLYGSGPQTTKAS